jgi:hypothetical protein
VNRNTIVAHILTGVALLFLPGCGEDEAAAPVVPGGPVGSSPVFTEVPIPPAGLTGVRYCSLAWGDADNDGDLDLAVAGRDMGGRITKVYENVGGAVPSDERTPGPLFRHPRMILVRRSRTSTPWRVVRFDSAMAPSLRGRGPATDSAK